MYEEIVTRLRAEAECPDNYQEDSELMREAADAIEELSRAEVITYTLESENGASLKAANFTFEGAAGGLQWTGTRRRDYYVSPEEMKNRWKYQIGGARE